MNIKTDRIVYEIKKLIEQMQPHSIDEKIYMINECKKILHENSPFVNEPVD